MSDQHPIMRLFEDAQAREELANLDRQWVVVTYSPEFGFTATGPFDAMGAVEHANRVAAELAEEVTEHNLVIRPTVLMEP